MRRGYRDYLQGLLQPRDRNKTLTGLAGAERISGAQHREVQQLALGRVAGRARRAKAVLPNARLAGDHRHPAVTQHGLRDGTLQRRNLAFAPDRPNHRTIIAAHRQPGTTTRPPPPIQASVTPRQQRRGSTRSAPDVSVRNRSHCQPSTVPGEAPASSDDPSTATSR